MYGVYFVFSRYVDEEKKKKNIDGGEMCHRRLGHVLMADHLLVMEQGTTFEDLLEVKIVCRDALSSYLHNLYLEHAVYIFTVLLMLRFFNAIVYAPSSRHFGRRLYRFRELDFGRDLNSENE